MRKYAIVIIMLLLAACLPVTSTPDVTPVATVTYLPSNTPEPTETIDPTPTQEIAAIGVAYTTENSWVRSDPSVQDDNRVRIVREGTTLTVYRVYEQWLLVDGGWIYNGEWVIYPYEESQTSRVGYNTLEVYDTDYFFEHLEKLCPRYMLFIDNLSLAIETYERLHDTCGTDVIHRDYSRFEGDEYVRRTPQQFVNTWVAQGHPEIIRYTTNEPSCGEATSCTRLVEAEVETARLAREAGFTISMLNMGVGRQSLSDVINGVFNPAVQAALDYDMILGFHEYTFGSLSFGFGTEARESLFDPVTMQPENWDYVPFSFVPNTWEAQTIDPQTFGEEELQRYINETEYFTFYSAYAANDCGTLPSYWHLGRSFWIELWYSCTVADELPTVVHTEWGWDYMADVNDVLNPLAEQYGMDRFSGDMRGWRSLEDLWSFWWPQWSTQEAAYNQIEYAIANYPQNHYFLLFAWSDNPDRDWTRAGYSFGNYGDAVTINLHKLMEP